MTGHLGVNRAPPASSSTVVFRKEKYSTVPRSALPTTPFWENYLDEWWDQRWKLIFIYFKLFTSAFAEVLILRVISLARSLDRSLTPVTQKLK